MKYLLAAMLFMASACAEEIENRFQMMASYNGDKTEIYVLDRKDGTMWMTEKKFLSNNYKEWKPLPLLPINQQIDE